MAKATGITDIHGWSVMKAKCRTCPFNTHENGREQSPDIAAKVKFRCITTELQIGHHPKLQGKRQDHLCRGARDYQLQVFYRLGFS